MAATVYGTAHLYGVNGNISGVTVNSFRFTNAPVNTAQVDNESGNQIERRYDDVHSDAVIEVTLRANYNIPNAKGTILSYQSTNYEIQSLEKAEQKKGYQMLTFNIKNSEYITSA